MVMPERNRGRRFSASAGKLRGGPLFGGYEPNIFPDATAIRTHRHREEGSATGRHVATAPYSLGFRRGVGGFAAFHGRRPRATRPPRPEDGAGVGHYPNRMLLKTPPFYG
jgi:hypothetical protein